MPKIKTHSGAKKRFNLTKNGKVKRAHAFKSHILTKKDTKRTRNLRKNTMADKTNVKAIKLIVYTFSGFCCGIAALLLTSRLDSAVPTNAEGYEMNAIAAVVIGGTSMSGGEGSLIGTVIGTMLIGVIANGMNLLLIPTGPQRMVTGSIIVIAVIVDVLRKKANSKSK